MSVDTALGAPADPAGDSTGETVDDTADDRGADTAGTVPRVVPTATYRLQLHAGWGFDAAAGVVGQLAALGVSHLYLSPVLQAVPGSLHGYDVLDHTRLSEDLGGQGAFDRLAARAREHGLGIVVDVVPNHMARPTPESGNAPFWSVLRDGRGSAHADWFDIDWEAGGGRVLLPVLGSALGDVLAAGELTVDGDVLRYFDHEFPLAAGTAVLGLPELLDVQHYRLAWWRTGAAELNYRRFFDVDSLVAIRVEDAGVFDATHAVLLDLYRRGAVDGFRIDHPDGLADPGGYLDMLATATDGAWVVAEKILEDGEELPAGWACAGTTGYDALNLVQGLFVDPAGADALLRLWTETSGDPRSAAAVVEASERQIATTVLDAEVERLTRIAAREAAAGRRDLSPPRLKAAVLELLVAMEVYRGYAGTEQGAAVVGEALDRARTVVPDLAVELDFVAGLAVTPVGAGGGGGVGVPSPGHVEFTARFGQTAGPVMAKGIEDTAFYRWHPLSCLTEVGGDPARFGRSADDFHAWCTKAAATHPAGMTTLSTHDTKRSEDTRARLAVLAEHAADWVAVVARLRDATADRRPARLDGAIESLLWQTLYAVSPWDGGPRGGAVAAARLDGYLEKSMREAKVHTTWTAPDEAYEAAVHGFAADVLGDGAVLGVLADFAERTAPAVRAVTLGQKLVQLTMPGVPDLYQGCEIVSRTLVDPDNRADVDHDAIAGLLADLDRGDPATDLDAEKLLVVSRALRLRRRHPEVFTGAYTALATGTPHAVGYLRGARVAVVVARFVGRPGGDPLGDDPLGGGSSGGSSGGGRLGLPAGTWTDELTGRVVSAAADGVALREVLDHLPVALLVLEETS